MNLREQLSSNHTTTLTTKASSLSLWARNLRPAYDEWPNLHHPDGGGDAEDEEDNDDDDGCELLLITTSAELFSLYCPPWGLERRLVVGTEFVADKDYVITPESHFLRLDQRTLLPIPGLHSLRNKTRS